MQRQTHLYFYWILFLSHFQKKSSCWKKILIGTINFIYALMYPKVCILHYFYFPYRCWYAIHYQTQMDFQNPISLLQFFHFSVDFLCLIRITASGAFGTFWLQPVQGNSSSVRMQGGSAVSLAWPHGPLFPQLRGSSPNQNLGSGGWAQFLE